MRALTIALVLGLAGCATHTWQKPGASADDFYADMDVCTAIAARINAAVAPAWYAYYVEKYSSDCLEGKGWRKVKQ